MKTLQLVLLKTFGFLILTLGLLLAWWFYFPELRARVIDPTELFLSVDPVFRVGAVWLLVLLGLAALLPARLTRSHDRKILVPSASGNNYIRLEPIESNLNKSLRKLPGVKRISVTLIPAEGERKVRVTADVTLRKGLPAGAREVVTRLNDQIMAHTKRELGADEVMSVELTVIGGLGIGPPASVEPAEEPTQANLPRPRPLDISQDVDEGEALSGMDEEDAPEVDRNGARDFFELPDEEEEPDEDTSSSTRPETPTAE
jgi:hypothetical protein